MVEESLKDNFWINSMLEELNEFIRNDVWELFEAPPGKTINGTKWIFINKMDKDGIVVRNKDRLVA